MNNKTLNALLARSICFEKAKYLTQKGFTLAKLQNCPKDELLNLGLLVDEIDLIKKSGRPPIPIATLNNLLIKSKFTCCVCRKNINNIIVHHIDPWHESQNHDESNLVVLCLEHHDKAHKQDGLSLNLTADRLRAFKKQWEDYCLIENDIYIKSLNNKEYARWDWFNFARLQEFGLNNPETLKNLSEQKNNITTILRRKNLIDDNGFIDLNVAKNLSKPSRFNDFYEGMYIAEYLHLILLSLFKVYHFIDITPFIKNKTFLKDSLNIGDYIAFQGFFYFKPIGNTIKNAYYRGHGVRISYTYDSYYCTSCSAQHDSMTGNQIQTIFARINSILKDEDGILYIKLSCFAAGSYFDNHRARENTFAVQDESIDFERLDSDNIT